jgi:hypothetical protein
MEIEIVWLGYQTSSLLKDMYVSSLFFFGLNERTKRCSFIKSKNMSSSTSGCLAGDWFFNLKPAKKNGGM